MLPDERLFEAVKAEVERIQEEAPSCHDFSHTMRVLANTERLARMENADEETFFAARIAAVEAMTLDLYKYSDGLTIRIRDRLLDVLKDSGLNVDLNDERMLKEVVFFADKADVTEELTRLASHCTQFREFMRSEEAVGRSLDFLMQEMFREITTYGNKASGTGASKLVVDFKTALEKLREQIQNVE